MEQLRAGEYFNTGIGEKLQNHIKSFSQFHGNNQNNINPEILKNRPRKQQNKGLPKTSIPRVRNSIPNQSLNMKPIATVIEERSIIPRRNLPIRKPPLKKLSRAPNKPETKRNLRKVTKSTTSQPPISVKVINNPPKARWKYGQNKEQSDLIHIQQLERQFLNSFHKQPPTTQIRPMIKRFRLNPNEVLDEIQPIHHHQPIKRKKKPIRLVVEDFLSSQGPKRQKDIIRHVNEKISEGICKTKQKTVKIVREQLSTLFKNGRVRRTGNWGNYLYEIVESHLIPESTKPRKRGRKKKEKMQIVNPNPNQPSILQAKPVPPAMPLPFFKERLENDNEKNMLMNYVSRESIDEEDLRFENSNNVSSRLTGKKRSREGNGTENSQFSILDTEQLLRNEEVKKRKLSRN